MFETLMARGERLRSGDMDHYLRTVADNRNLNSDKFVIKGEANESYASHNTSTNDIRSSITKELLNSLCKIVDGRSIHLLDKQDSKVCMPELKHKYNHIGAPPESFLQALNC